jgi:hypothetical protein
VEVDTLPSASGELAAEHRAGEARLLDDYVPWLGPFLFRGVNGAIVPAEPGWCYAYFGTASSGVRDLDMTVLHRNGRVAGTDSMLDATPYVQHCADVAEEMTVILELTRGRGSVAFSVLRKPD